MIFMGMMLACMAPRLAGGTAPVAATEASQSEQHRTELVVQIAWFLEVVCFGRSGTLKEKTSAAENVAADSAPEEPANENCKGMVQSGLMAADVVTAPVHVYMWLFRELGMGTLSCAALLACARYEPDTALEKSLAETPGWGGMMRTSMSWQT